MKIKNPATTYILAVLTFLYTFTLPMYVPLILIQFLLKYSLSLWMMPFLIILVIFSYLFSLLLFTVPFYRILISKRKDGYTTKWGTTKYIMSASMLHFVKGMFNKIPGFDQLYILFIHFYGMKHGKNFHAAGSSILNPELIETGENVFFGKDAIISGHVIQEGKIFLKKIKIGNNVTIGGGAIVFPGTVIEDDVIVGANAVVSANKHIQKGTIFINKK